MINHAIGIPRETKLGEKRVALTPLHVEQLVRRHNRIVFVEHEAGFEAGYSNDDYVRVGATVCSKEELYDNAKFIIKVKEPNEHDLPFITEQHILFCYLHLAAFPELTKSLLEKKITAVAFESVVEHKRSGSFLPLLAPMSIIAGKLSIHMAHDVLRMARGELIDHETNVVIVGAGNVGVNAARVALGLGAAVTLFDVSMSRLQYAYQLYGYGRERVNTICLSEHPDALENMLRDPASKISIVVCGALVPDNKAPKLITTETLNTMSGVGFRPTVFVDVSIDQGGCIEGIKQTNLNQTWYREEKHYFIAVPNMPGSVARTASTALADEILPYAALLGARFNHDTVALSLDVVSTLESFNSGIVLQEGKIVNDTLKQIYGSI